ncbi:MAG: membrane dipeptidase, partial [Planctomycetes bacterium]|nr:membrane dipeptidase [Planctomycetota bacterium]
TAKLGINVATLVDHIDHIVQLVGPNHVGFGSDFDGVGSLPDSLADCADMPNITKELVARGYSAKNIEKILGGNFMRVFREVCDR